MNTKHFAFIGLGAALALASCTNDIPGSDENVYDGPVETNFLSVNIVGQGAAKNLKGTRADNDYDSNDDDNYKDGVVRENAVDNVRFYFFNEDKTPSEIVGTSNNFVSYVDWTNPGSSVVDDDTPNNLERVVNAELIISTKVTTDHPNADRPKGKPTYVIAVVNPTTAIKNLNPTNLDDFKKQVSNYTASTDNAFLMTNSVYATPKNATEYDQVCELNITPHLYTSADAAKDDPVEIYVERVTAKVSLNTSLTEVTSATLRNLGPGEVAYDTQVTDNDGNKIYVKFLGWNVTATANQTYLVKNISESWTNNSIFDTNDIDWNSPTRFRSFWAVNPSGTTVVYGNFNGNNDLSSAQAIKSFKDYTGTTEPTDKDEWNFTYLPENAGEAISGDLMKCATPSQVIVAAQLLDNTGSPLTIAQYGATYFVPNDLLTMYAERSNVYKITEGNEGQTVYTKITAGDLTFATAAAVAEAEEAAEPTTGRYYVYPRLASGENYCVGNAENTEADADDANAALKALGHAKVWQSGNTYYFFDIAHLGQEHEGSVGEKGVVRNHWYQATINALSGLGTPVYNPNEVIYPEKTTPEDSFIGAKINILNWRLVPQSVSFAW